MSAFGVAFDFRGVMSVLRIRVAFDFGVGAVFKNKVEWVVEPTCERQTNHLSSQLDRNAEGA